MSPIRLVTFDVTGTLLTFRTPVLNQYAEVAAKFGIKANAARLQINFKKASKELSMKHPNYGQATGLGWQDWWRRIVHATFDDELTGDTNKKVINDVAEELLHHFETNAAYEVVDGSVSLIESLKKDNIDVGVVSNFDPRLHIILENVGLAHYFKFILTSYEFGGAKPDFRIFHAALEKCQITDGREAVHVGNDPKLDYGGATTAGLNAVLVSAESPLVLPKVVNRISQVRDCIDIINGKN